MKGILINYEYCTGCHSCEIACQNERGLPGDQWGIKVLELGPIKLLEEKKWGWKERQRLICQYSGAISC